ncbi:probable WRKY transcription factor 2 [Elaeis guineensis]|uniref:Probable WRKY transcription factor 2 n=1 Tax=Elaeis guineensis var. tenera TaxID=51953 RepID=A0A8N4ICB2_ELAGV|nr:probable WRKY transcription factor 2 [Elaeis guineensis]
MAGLDDNAVVIGEMMPWTPSHRSFLSDFKSDEFGTQSSDSMQNGNQAKVSTSDKQDVIMNSKDEESETRIQFPSDSSSELSSLDVQKSSMRGGLAERIAARAGFSSLRLNTAEIRQAIFSSSTTDVCPLYITIPPGLSPAALLNSPVFLSNSMAESSPTRGKFPFTQCTNNCSMSDWTTPDKRDSHTVEDMDPQLFAFKPQLGSSSRYTSCAENKADPKTNHQHSSNIKELAQSDCPAQTKGVEPSLQCQPQQDFKLQDGLHDSLLRKDGLYDSTNQRDTTEKTLLHQSTTYPVMGREHPPAPDDPQDGGVDTKGEVSSLAVGTPAEDGYNWRKYGQKQVKGSEFPRSYYKCTHPNCPVKKKVERSQEGHITEIIYKGAHNHPRLSHSFRSMQLEGSEQRGLQSGCHGEQHSKVNTRNGTSAHDGRNDGLEATLSPSRAAEFRDTSTSMLVTEGCASCEIKDAMDVSSALSNNQEENDQANHGSMSQGCDGEGDEIEPKRRKLDAGALEMSASSKVVREPRVVVQTTSEVDILDDGYRWRKYGQKVVKGNPNPRSYYKCTNPGCIVRKHVERASHDLKSVITTYEGKHNHEVPAARNNCQASCGSFNAPQTSAPQPQSLDRRPELAQMQERLARLEWPPPLGKACTSGSGQLAPTSSFSFGINQGLAMNLAMAGFGPLASMQMPMPPLGYSFLHDHHRASEGGFMASNGEPEEKPISEPRLPASINHQLTGRIPLGPQL